jgi:hypothetical protein
VSNIGRNKERIYNFGTETPTKATMWKWIAKGRHSGGVEPLDSEVKLEIFLVLLLKEPVGL